MIDRGHDLPIAQQAKALGISRGSVYYLPRPVLAAELAVMRRMDELHLELPFAGSRMLRDLLNKEGIAIGRCHVATLMKPFASRRSTASRAPRSLRRGTRSTRISCAG
jgi:putative transposase